MAQESKAKQQFNGIERSAILLMTLGEKDAAEILKHMNPKEVQKVGEAMARLGSIGRETVDQVLAEFCDTVDEQTSLGIGNEEYLRNVLVNALESQGIFVSSGSACNSKKHAQSAVMQAMNIPSNHGIIRFSFSKKTSPDHIERASNIIRKTLLKLWTN